jgi:hypothetical protein
MNMPIVEQGYAVFITRSGNALTVRVDDDEVALLTSAETFTAPDLEIGAVVGYDPTAVVMVQGVSLHDVSLTEQQQDDIYTIGTQGAVVRRTDAGDGIVFAGDTQSAIATEWHVVGV